MIPGFTTAFKCVGFHFYHCDKLLYDHLFIMISFPIFAECEIDCVAWSDDSLFLAIGERYVMALAMLICNLC